MGVTNKVRGVTMHAGGTVGDIADPQIAINTASILLKATLGAVEGVRTPTANDILVLADAGKVVEMNNASARTITVPPNSSVAFATGTIIHLTRLGAGTVALVEGSGVTIRSADDEKFIAIQYSGATLYKRGENEWVLFGNLAAS